MVVDMGIVSDMDFDNLGGGNSYRRLNYSNTIKLTSIPRIE